VSLNISPSSPENALHQALQQHRDGHFAEAERLYRLVLEHWPNHIDALHYLGVLLAQTGRVAAGRDAIERAIALAPDNAQFHNNLGKLHSDAGRTGEAIACFRRALQCDGQLREAHTNLGNALTAAGQFEQAIHSYHHALLLQSDHAETHNNLGNALRASGRMEEAVSAYREACRHRPNLPEPLNNLGYTLRELGRLDEAIECCRRALQIKPDYMEAYDNLGTALASAGRYQEAIALYRQAMLRQPDHAETHNNLGNALNVMGRQDDALAAYREAIRLKPGYAEAHTNLGNALKDQGLLDAAIESFRKALRINPALHAAHSNLINTLQFHPGYDAPAQFEELRRFHRQHAEPLRQFIQPHANDRAADRPLRVGYVSADFRDHVIGRNMVPLLREHDQDRFEIFCYTNSISEDLMTRLFRRYAHAWRSIAALSDAQAADLIRRDAIDILVDLSVHTSGNRLLVFARKPAPVQVTFAGYPGSTGLEAIDYRLTDPPLDPPGPGDAQPAYSEESIRLPDSFWCYDPLGENTAISSLPVETAGRITFGCLNNFCKINDEVLRLWGRVLQSIPDSRLMLLTSEGSHRERTLRTIGEAGIAADRIEFCPPRPRPQYLELYHRIDLGLDSFPYNGHTTSLDSLWMGVPVVTLAGRTVVGRAGLSQLTNLDLRELVAETPETFVQIATGLANDRPRLAALRGSLRQRMENSPLMNAPRFARHIENAYRRVWTHWCGTHGGC
jgi:protein O-GlcNAc transferase